MKPVRQFTYTEKRSIPHYVIDPKHVLSRIMQSFNTAIVHRMVRN